jgi:DnaJ-class molecular chaperone
MICRTCSGRGRVFRLSLVWSNGLGGLDWWAACESCEGTGELHGPEEEAEEAAASIFEEWRGGVDG